MFEESRRSRYSTTFTSGFSGAQRLRRRLGLRLADAVGGVDDLALQVRVVDDVRVDDPERADAGRREVERRGRAEAAGADQEHLRREQPSWPGLADLGDQDVPAVAAALVGVEDRRRLPGVAVLLPAREAARERRDVLVAELASALVANAERAPDWHVTITGVARSGTTLSMRDSSKPRGTCTEPGIAPCSYSSSSRTSISTGASAPASSASRLARVHLARSPASPLPGARGSSASPNLPVIAASPSGGADCISDPYAKRRSRSVATG